MSGGEPNGSHPAILGAAPASHGELVPEAEALAVQAITDSITGQVRGAAQGVPARRDAHPKAHGCVHATFEVLGDLPAALRVGLFQSPQVFDAWIRFSNGSGKPQPDRIGDGRGMAVKILGVMGSASGTQDFIMINAPAFFVRNAADYVQFQTVSPQWRFFFPGFNPFAFRWHELSMARAITAQKIANPLDARYWSMVPILCGETACKVSARPAGAPSAFTATDTDDYLHANLASHLAQGPASFDFMVQLQADPAIMPVEDPTIIWPEAASPFVPVARITIPAQSFDSPEQRAFCENLSFTPWHSLPAHRPLGGINRVRRVVYEAVSSLRHQLNGAPREEPQSSQDASGKS